MSSHTTLIFVLRTRVRIAFQRTHLFQKLRLREELAQRRLCAPVSLREPHRRLRRPRALETRQEKCLPTILFFRAARLERTWRSRENISGARHAARRAGDPRPSCDASARDGRSPSERKLGAGERFRREGPLLRGRREGQRGFDFLGPDVRQRPSHIAHRTAPLDELCATHATTQCYPPKIF
jgi:hypothetical protein